MHKLKFLILFIFFVQAVPNILDVFQSNLYISETKKCSEIINVSSKDELKGVCISRTSKLLKGNNDSKCCFYTIRLDPVLDYKEQYGDNWKKIAAQKYGYDLNISVEEIRKRLMLTLKRVSFCDISTKSSKNSLLYFKAHSSIDGIVRYDCGEGEKAFNKKDFHPQNKDEMMDKELIDSSLSSFSMKECLKKGTKLSSEDYQLCWCERIPLSFNGNKYSDCIAFKTSNFQGALKIRMNEMKKLNMKEEYKCTCSNNKSKTIYGRYNSITGYVKVY